MSAAHPYIGPERMSKRPPQLQRPPDRPAWNQKSSSLSSQVIKRRVSGRGFQAAAPASAFPAHLSLRDQGCVETNIFSLLFSAPVSTSNPFETTSSARIRPSMIFEIGSLPDSTNPMIRGHIVIG